MFSKHWWKATAERAIKSAAQGFLLAVGSDALGWLALDWKAVAVATVGMGILSLATSLATTNAGPDKNTPSLV